MTPTNESLATPKTATTTVIGAAIGITVGWILTTVVYLAGSPIRVKTGWQSSGAKLTAVEYLLTVTISVALGGQYWQLCCSVPGTRFADGQCSPVASLWLRQYRCGDSTYPPLRRAGSQSCTWSPAPQPSPAKQSPVRTPRP
jgi:hypothetical protein